MRGNITTIVGTGTAGFGGDGGPADKALLNNPFFVAFDRHGVLFIADSGNNAVRRVERGRISTVVGSGAKGNTGDGGPATQATFNDLVAIAVTDAGDIYAVDRLNNRVRRVDGRTGVVSAAAGDGASGDGGDGGPGDRAHLKQPHDCVLDGRGGLLIADVNDCRIRRLDTKSGTISTFAGDGTRAHRGDGGQASAASFWGSRALAVDGRDGTVYVCEREGNTVRRIDGRTGVVTTIAGTGKKGYSGDGGQALAATFNGPKGLCCDRAGNVYVLDTENHAVRGIEVATGVITTVAGGRKGAGGDGGPSHQAGLNRPHGATIGPDKALYIADTENHRIRRVAPG